ncbi:hypothetical protein K502DRAFT_153338 [Neoconidiobolus thromboides FSU 785]|nr:hypothetical protein K502DRAFT_153338 [Neoconidiobolus thromboides FSU 785]
MGSGEYVELNFEEYIEDESSKADKEDDDKNPLNINNNNEKNNTGIEGLSFNLSLTDKQKEAKEQVKLPYLATSQSELKLGTIHYHPDDNDDFDEDDPDDDLEI